MQVHGISSTEIFAKCDLDSSFISLNSPDDNGMIKLVQKNNEATINATTKLTINSDNLIINSAIKVAGNYTGVSNGSVTPIPSTGEGTIIFYNSHFFGWTGSEWRQLDNIIPNS